MEWDGNKSGLLALQDNNKLPEDLFDKVAGALWRLKKKNKLEKSQQDDSAPSAPQTQQTIAPNTVEIQEYLSRNTKAIPLPELFHKDDNTYAPLILDGASGMGKMQQAFALLKTGK